MVDALLPLPTSSWRTGDGGYQAGFEAMVAVSEDGLVIGVSRWGRRAGLIWPAGYVARLDAEGRAEIVRPDGRVAVREGEWFFSGGSAAAPSAQGLVASAESAFRMEDELVRLDPPWQAAP